MGKYLKKILFCLLISIMILQAGCGREEDERKEAVQKETGQKETAPKGNDQAETGQIEADQAGDRQDESDGSGFGRLELLFQYEADYWKIYDLSESAIPEQEDYETLAKQYCEDIQELLMLEQWWEDVNPEADTLVVTLKITDTEGKRSHSEYCVKGLKNEVATTITLGGYFLAQPGYDGFLAHELTHAMAGPAFSQSLEEGLCCYVQDSVGVKKVFHPGMQDKGVEYWQCFKTYYENTKETWGSSAGEEYASVMDSIGKAERGYDFSGHARTVWQWYSESFVRYLVEQHGMDKVMELINEGESDGAYEQVLGRTLEELCGEWLLFVDDMEQEYTWDEAVKMEEEYLQK